MAKKDSKHKKSSSLEDQATGVRESFRRFRHRAQSVASIPQRCSALTIAKPADDVIFGIEGYLVVHEKTKKLRLLSTKRRYWIGADATQFGIVRNAEKHTQLYRLALHGADLHYLPDKTISLFENHFTLDVKAWTKNGNISFHNNSFEFYAGSEMLWKWIEFLTNAIQQLKLPEPKVEAQKKVADTFAPPSLKTERSHHSLRIERVRDNEDNVERTNSISTSPRSLQKSTSDGNIKEAFDEAVKEVKMPNEKLDDLKKIFRTRLHTKDVSIKPFSHVLSELKLNVTSPRKLKTSRNNPGVNKSEPADNLRPTATSPSRSLPLIQLPVENGVEAVGLMGCFLIGALDSSAICPIIIAAIHQYSQRSNTKTQNVGSYLKTVVSFMLPFLTAQYWTLSSSIPFIFVCAAISKYTEIKEREIIVRQNDYLVLGQLEKHNFGELSLPAWISFPDVERVTWLNVAMAKFWPWMKVAIKDSLVDLLQPILNENKPYYLSSLIFGHVDFGKFPPHIDGVKCISGSHSDGEVTVDVDVRYVASVDQIAEICIHSGIGVATSIKLHDLCIIGQLRVIFKPLCNNWPCFSAISISFMSKPQVEFSLNAAKVNIKSVPFASEWLQTFLQETLVNTILWPEIVEIPLHLEHYH